MDPSYEEILPLTRKQWEIEDEIDNMRLAMADLAPWYALKAKVMEMVPLRLVPIMLWEDHRDDAFKAYQPAYQPSAEQVALILKIDAMIQEIQGGQHAW